MSDASDNMREPEDIRFRIPGINYDSPEEDLLPEMDEQDMDTLLSWSNSAFDDAKWTRSESENRWMKYYKMYRSFVAKRPAGDWRSRVWIPLSFYVVETIVPRLVAQLPKLTVEPVGPEDVEGAKQMEHVLDYVTEQSDLYLELVKAFRSALMYGTGILKTCYDEKYAVSIQPEMLPQYEEMPTGQTDIMGNEQMTQVQVGETPGTEMTRQKILKYAGPAAEAVDLFDFFVSPEAQDIDDASYVCHRVWRTRQHIERLANQGHYHLPNDVNWDELSIGDNDPNPHVDRLNTIGLGPGNSPHSAKGTKLIELREFWTDDVVFVVAGAKTVIRVERNPYGHGEKPFVRIVDHMIQNEFFGIGELEPLEGIQDAVNSLWNTRIDNVKLVINKMFAVSVDYLENENDLKVKPGGIVRLTEGVPIDQAFRPIDMGGDVTGSAYEEVGSLEALSEKVSGVSAYQMGTDSPSLNRTATGVALISEQGNTRFAHKVRISELTGLRRLARHFGSILQQFMPEGFYVRLQGPGGQFLFETIDPQSIAGAFDYNIEAESASQTESLRRDQAMSLFSTLAGMPEINRVKLIEDVLEVFGKKDIPAYLNALAIMQEQMAQQQQMMMMQQGQLPPGEEDASGAPATEPAGATGGTEQPPAEAAPTG